MNKALRVIISGGGTGGHIFLAISIAQELKRSIPGVEILFVGAQDRMEMQKIPEAGFDIKGLPVKGFSRKCKWKNIPVFFWLLRSLVNAYFIIRRFKPEVVVGVGSYASGPVVKMAGRMGIPVLIQEQNSYAGITNRWLAPQASTICVAYEEMNKYFPLEKIVLTGNPVREEIVKSKVSSKKARAYFGIPPDYRTILILGGSLGAGTINRAILSHIERIRNKPVFLIWQTGRNDYARIRERMQHKNMDNILITDFIRRMDMAYAAASLIVSRAGAGTISELAVVGKAVILVPSPNVAEDHQTKNAMTLVERNAALIITDNDAEDHLLTEALKLLNDDQKMQILAGNLRKFAKPDASRDIVKEICRIAANRK